ncbi:tetratricopeptide repeat protein [Falsibacillus albus]|uniref:Uncharacterized protein n=1 Tax=Falsibacillus albus TaxID=2478915 RepID=A0A3L7JW69_9BACI|nr:tetratricopeptide repeat protein [Falsibacillus albus]RLQ95107.1 hypothetical protein D9X91_11440 [Falsibacillus albus]
MLLAQEMLQELEKGNLPEAKKLLAMTLEEGTDEEKFYLGEELYQLGFVEEAKGIFEHLAERFPDEGELIVLIAECLVEMDREEEALAMLDRLPATDPSYPRALLLSADLYQMQGLYEVSEQKLRNAKALLPEEVIIQFALGELYSEQGKFSDAAGYYEKLIAANEEVIAGVNIHQRLAEVLSAGGAFEDALTHYEKAMEEQVEPNTLFGFAFTAYQAGFYKKAIEKFTELKETDPEYHSLYLFLARCYEQEEQLDEALAAVQEGIRLDEYNKELYLFGGKIALKLNDEKMAENHLRQSLALDPDYIEAALVLNKLLLKQERFEDVLEIIDMMDKDGETDPQFNWDAASAHAHLEQYSDALNYYRLAYNDFKTNSDFLEEFGYFLIEEGLRDEAIFIFKELMQQDPANEEYILLLERLEE